MEKPTITAVSYLNTLPFVYGINSQMAGLVDLSLDVPAVCAKKIIGKEVSFGLTPAGILPLIDEDYRPLPFCIGAEGAVSTVMLFSRVPLQEITKVYLDADSRTSVLLVRVLSRHYWNITPEWVDYSVIRDLTQAESLLAIGDKAFALKEQFPYQYDLALEWQKMTGLPFVFALWVAAKNTTTEARRAVEAALEFGVVHIRQAIESCPPEKYQGIDLETYLNHDIHFRMDDSFRKGLDTFLRLIVDTKI